MSFPDGREITIKCAWRPAESKTWVEMSEHAQGLRGHVRVRSVASAVVGFLARDLHTFMGMHPQVQVEIQEGLNLEVLHSVESRASDIGVVGFPTTPAESIETFSYRNDELVVHRSFKRPGCGQTRPGNDL